MVPPRGELLSHGGLLNLLVLVLELCGFTLFPCCELLGCVRSLWSEDDQCRWRSQHSECVNLCLSQEAFNMDDLHPVVKRVFKKASSCLGSC